MPWNGATRTTIRPRQERQFQPRFRERLYTDDEVEWEDKMSPSQAIATSLRVVTAPSSSQDASKSKRLAHLSALVKMWQKREAESDVEGLRLEEIMLCLRIPLVNESTEIRAATLRTLRLLIKTGEAARAITTLNIHYLVSRCLDIELDNKIERLQALKMCRCLAYTDQGEHFPMILIKSLVAIAEEGKSKDDRFYRAALGLLCELSVINHGLFIEAGGVKALTYCLLDTSMSKIAEAILGSLLRLHNDPLIRPKANVNLGVVVAPFTEFSYIHSNLGGLALNAPTEKIDVIEERQKRLKCAEQAFLSTMRSWSGLLQLCQPRTVGPSHLQAVVDILYLKNNEVRQYLINMFYELLNIRAPAQPNFMEALKVADPSTFKDSWKLADGFVAAEGLDILPHISRSRPNLVENHMSLVLHCLLKCDLPDALVNVIVDSEDLLSVSATVLLGQLLHLANLLLPREVNVISHCLPGLLKEVSSFDLKKATRAQEAVAALQKLHAIKKRGPKANSLFLDQILSTSGSYSGECFVGDRLHWTNFLKAYNDEKLKANIKLSSVNINYDANVWNWDLVTAIFKSPLPESFKALDVADYKNFVRRIMDYYKPTNGRFCRLELSNSQCQILARTACYLLDFLVEATSPEADRILDDFLRDIQDCLASLIHSESAQECLLSPTRVATTGCQYYFLFIGRLSRSRRGREALDKRSILGHFTELLGMRSDLYLKLVISCLDYSSMEWGSRTLLSKALKEGSETCRIYATKFLGVLMRAKAHNVAHWGLELISAQLFDSSSKIVPIVALTILDEAADEGLNLEAIVCALQNRDLSHLGTRGELLKIRLIVSSTYGAKVLNNSETLTEMLNAWKAHYNEEYVVYTEDLINDGLTKHQRDDDLSYGRRTFEAYSLRPAFVPYHLYGQLASSKQGLEALIRHPDIHDILAQLTNAGDTNWLKTKAAMWSVANVCISHEGACFVDREGGIESLIRIADSSPVLSLKATAFYALGLVATTRYGCHVLASKGWCTLKYGRDDPWPVLEDWFVRFQLATLLDDDNNQEDLEDENEELKRRSSSLPYTPIFKDEELDETNISIESSSGLPPRSSSMSSRKRLSNLFKSLSDKRENKTGSLTRRIRTRLFKDESNTDKNTSLEAKVGHSAPVSRQASIDEEGGKSAPIATPEQSQSSSSGEALEEIKEEIEIIASSSGPKTTDQELINPCNTESSTTSSLLHPTTMVSTSSMTTKTSPTATMSKPLRMKQRSGQRAYSESEAQSFLQNNPISSIVPGASISSMASTGSYTDNPGFFTLRSIHSRHRPVLDFIETGEDHEHHSHHQEAQNRSENFNKTRHPSGSGKRVSYVANRKKLLAPFTDDDFSKTINDRYWGITLPAKCDALINDGVQNFENNSFGQDPLSTPPSPVTFDYHSEENCLKCFNFLDAPETGPNSNSRHRSSSLTMSANMLNTSDLSNPGTKSTLGSPIQLRKARKSGSTLAECELAKQRMEQRKEALKVISTLNATVGATKTENVLLKMKQQSPVIFKNPCFYSEVCQLMSHFSFRLSSRRFIQELFMDVNFEVLSEDARHLLAAHNHCVPPVSEAINDESDSTNSIQE